MVNPASALILSGLIVAAPLNAGAGRNSLICGGKIIMAQASRAGGDKKTSHAFSSKRPLVEKRQSFSGYHRPTAFNIRKMGKFIAPVSATAQITVLADQWNASSVSLFRGSVEFGKSPGKRIDSYSLIFKVASEPTFSCVMGGIGVRAPLFTVNGITMYGYSEAALGAKNGKFIVSIPAHIPFECLPVGNGALAFSLFAEFSNSYKYPDASYLSGIMPAAPGICGLDISYWPSKNYYVSATFGGTSVELKDSTTAACLISVAAGFIGKDASLVFGLSSSTPFPLGDNKEGEYGHSWGNLLGASITFHYNLPSGGQSKTPVRSSYKEWPSPHRSTYE